MAQTPRGFRTIISDNSYSPRPRRPAILPVNSDLPTNETMEDETKKAAPSEPPPSYDAVMKPERPERDAKIQELEQQLAQAYDMIWKQLYADITRIAKEHYPLPPPKDDVEQSAPPGNFTVAEDVAPQPLENR